MAEDPLHLLCVEPRFPGRLGFVADWLVRRRGYRCRFYCTAAGPEASWPASVGRGLEIVPVTVGGVAREAAVPWTRDLERRLCYAFGLHETLSASRTGPVDVVLGRSAGLGSSLFTDVTLPRCPVVNLFDYYMPPRSGDLTSPADPPEYAHWRRAANVGDLLDLEHVTSAWTPTAWQRDSYPPEYRSDFLVLFDGVVVPSGRRAGPRIVAGQTLPDRLKVVTFVAGSPDRARGFDRFIAIANRLLAERSDVALIVAGDPTVTRGLDVEFFQRDYRRAVLARTPLHDPSRCWFLNGVTPAVVREMLAASDLHLHPTRLLPPARSLAEALAAGCVVLASDTPAVREWVTPGETGLLADGDDVDAWVRAALAVLADTAAHRSLGEGAMRFAREHLDRDVTLPRLARHFDALG